MFRFSAFIRSVQEKKDKEDYSDLNDMITDLIIEKSKKDSKFISFNDLKYYFINRNINKISEQFRCNIDIVLFCNDIETHERIIDKKRTIKDFNFVEKNIYFDYLHYLKTYNTSLLYKHGYWLIDNYNNTQDFNTFIKLRRSII